MDAPKAGTKLFHLAYLGRALKKRWMDITFPHGMRYRDEGGRFDRLYLVRDPWSLNCEREKFRFRETNRVIRKNFGHPHKLLELGCGEGLQSSELQKVCDHLYGIDASERAIRRAKRRCPQATFSVADACGPPQSLPSTRFNLVTACEILYYMTDVAGALKRVSELGQECLISYWHGVRVGMDEHVRGIPGVHLETVSYQDFSWTLAWWRP
jgi:hypothetical protein